jgi:hypothetical protein
MKRRTFLQLLGLTAAPIPPLVGADLGQALTAEDETGTALIRITTSIKPFYFKIPVKYKSLGNGVSCFPINNYIDMEAFEDMYVEKIEVRTHHKLAEFYKWIGMERGWIELPTSRHRCMAGETVTVTFSKTGLYSVC